MSISDKIYYKDEWATIYCGDNREILPELSGIDLVVTSPPYDDLREYGEYNFEFGDMPILLYNAMKIGGVIVWVVGDQTINGSETGSSFRQALCFMDNGFNLHDTMIYYRNSKPLSHNRYEQWFEYMFVFSIGKPNTFNPVRVDVSDNYRERRKYQFSSYKHRTKTGEYGKYVKYPHIYTTRIKENVWYIKQGFLSTKDKTVFTHPAIFPEALASDHIISWSNPNDLILDPFLGSGTTCYCAKKLNRRSIGIEINEKYCEIAKNRLAQSVMIL